MAANKRIKKFIKKRFVFILVSMISLVGILSYVYSRVNRSIKISVVEYDSISDIVESRGFIIRDEEIIENTCKESCICMVSDGERVSNGGTLAEIYSSPQEASKKIEINRLDSEIESLKSFNRLGGSPSRNLDMINSRIHDNINKISIDVTNGEYRKIDNIRSDILMSINEKRLVTGKKLGVSDKIREIEKKRDELIKSSENNKGLITAPCAGYFIGFTDGYEETLNYKNIRNLTLEDISSPRCDLSRKGLMGKIVKSVDWYVTFKVPAEYISKIHENDWMKIQIPSASSRYIPCKIECINQDDRSSEGVVIVSCDCMDRSLSSIRDESVKLCLSVNSGLKIEKRALHENVISKEVKENGQMKKVEKLVQGVYVKYGKNLVFKEVIPIYMDLSYVICEQFPKENTTFSNKILQLNDEVVVEGTELFGGKCIK